MTVIVCLLPHATISLMVTTALQATCDPGTTRGTHSQQVNNTDASISTYLHIVLCVCVSVCPRRDIERDLCTLVFLECETTGGQ